jgi:transposase
MESRRRFDKEFKEGAVRIVRETGKPIAQVARELGISDGTLGNWRRPGNSDNHPSVCVTPIARPPFWPSEAR